MGFLLRERYPLRLLDDNSLLLYAYGPKDQSIWFGLFFYSYFVPLWLISFILPFLALYYLYKREHFLFTSSYLLLLVWLYWPRKTLRIIRYAQLIWFFELPRYFRESSFLIMKPHEHPQLSRVLELYQNVHSTKGSSSSLVGTPFENRNYKNINLTPKAIIALTSLEKICTDRKSQIYPCDIFSCSPHGFTSHGWGQLSFCPFFNNVWNCVSTALYYLGHGVVAHSACLGNPHSVMKSAMAKTLSSGQAVSIVTGGFEEASLMSEEVDKVYLNKRMGIFKFAIDYNAGVVPYFSFGENRLYRNLQGFEQLRLLLNKYSIPGTLCIGAFLWWPRRDILHIVVGERITAAEGDSVESLKARYISDLQKMHNTYGQLFYGKRSYKQLQIL